MDAAVETKRTFCRFCHATCPLDAEVDVASNRVLSVRGVRDDPVFGGYTCLKGRQLPEQLSHPDRLRHPQRRVGGRLVPIGSRELFDDLAGQLGTIIAEHGPRAVATYTGTGAFQNSTSMAMAKAWHEAIGSTSCYSSVTIDQPAKVVAPYRLGVWEAGYHGFAGADVAMALGYNPMVSSYGPPGGVPGSNPFVTLREAKRDGLTLIVVDPRRTELAQHADLFLQIRPGQDAVLLAGIIATILDRGLHDREFCAAWVADLDRLARAVSSFTPELVGERCGVPGDAVIEAAHVFGRARRGTATTGTGPNMAPHSSLTEHLAMVLNTICGRVNQPGDRLDSGWFLFPPARRRCQVIPPSEPRTGPDARVRGLSGYHAEMPTATLAEEILTPGLGRIRALIVSGGNPVLAWPDQALTVRALEDLELLVVIDHRMTATAELAHAVIPPRLSLERADVPHVLDRWYPAPYINYTPAVVEAEGDVHAEWEVFWELARRLGTPIRVAGGIVPFDPKPSDDDVIDLMYAGSRLPLEFIRAHPGEVHPELALVAEPPDDTTGKFTVAPRDVVAELAELGADVGPPGYSFLLVSRRLKDALNSVGPEFPALHARAATNHAHLHPDDLAAAGVADGDLVSISSAWGTVVAVAASAVDLRRGVVSMAHGWGDRSGDPPHVRDVGAPANRLVSASDGHDPLTGMPVQSAIPVSIHKYSPTEPKYSPSNEGEPWN